VTEVIVTSRITMATQL